MSDVPEQIPSGSSGVVVAPSRRRQVYERLVGKEAAARNDLTRKVSTTVYMSQEQVAMLEALRDRTKVPTATRIRDAIDGIIDQAVEDGTLR